MPDIATGDLECCIATSRAIIERKISMSNSAGDIAVIVMTCDDFEWVWEGWAHWFKKHWCFDLPWKVYFATEDKDCPVDFVTGIKTGKGPWTDNVRNAMQQLPGNRDDTTILLMLEDYWIRHPVNPNMFMDLAQTFLRYDMDCLRVCCRSVATKTERTDILVGHEPLWRVSADSPYRFSLQASFWKWNTLAELLLPSADPWKQELEGTHQMRGSAHRIYKYNLDWYANAVRSQEFDTRDEFVEGYLSGKLYKGESGV